MAGTTCAWGQKSHVDFGEDFVMMSSGKVGHAIKFWNPKGKKSNQSKMDGRVDSRK